MVLDEAMEERIAEIVADFARRMKFDPEGLRDGTRKQAMVPGGLDPARSRPARRPAWSSRPARPVVVVLPGPPRELQAMWPAAVASEPVAELLDRADSLHDRVDEDVRDPGVDPGEDACARSSDDVDLEPLEITTCLRRGAELEIDVRYRTEDRGAARWPVRRRCASATSAHIYTESGESIDEIVAGLLAATGSRWRSPAPGASWRRG